MRVSENIIEIADFSSIDKILAEFRSKNNHIHPYDSVSNKLITCHISESDIKALRIAHKQGLDAVSVMDQHLHYYHVLLTSQLSDPQAWGMFPIVDSLNLTLEATDDELNRVIKFFHNNEGKDSTLLRVKHTGIPYKGDRRKKNRYLKKRHVWLEGDASKKIYLSCGLVGGKEYNEQRPIRISLNPSRFTGKELNKIFTAINDTKVFNNFWKSLAEANVTKIDMAIDLIGVPTPIVILDSPRVTSFSYVGDVTTEEDNYLQTQYVGKKSSSHFTIYSKVDKKRANNQKHVCTIEGPDKQPLYVSRIERVMKVQSNGSDLILRDLVDAPFMFKEAQFYSPLAFTELDTRQQEALAKGFLFTLIDSFKSAHGLDEDNLTQTVADKMRTSAYAGLNEKQTEQKLKKAMFSSMRQSIERHKITFAKTWFEERQKIILRNVLKFMLPKKYR